jgi:plasmid stability protein
MVFHMKTTLNIDDTVMARLRAEAARSGKTMSELVESALRQLLRNRASSAAFPPLPSFRGGEALVDIADRDALYRVMEGQ